MLLWPELKGRFAFGAPPRQIVGDRNVVADRGGLSRSNTLLIGDAPETAGALHVNVEYRYGG